jgi:hypothetical protein
VSIFKRIYDTKALWSIVLPHVKEPNDRFFAIWCGEHEDRVIEQTLARTAVKLPPNWVGDVGNVYRYVLGTSKNIVLRQREVAAEVGAR